MWFDGQRQPNTVYIANTSRGKDSTAMLRAIQIMGWPLDMIVSVDIWATKDIPAELPPMVAFKDKYDKKVLERFGVPVTRLCAQKPRSQIVKVEREPDARCCYESMFYTRTETKYYGKHIYGFPRTIGGCWCKKLKTEYIDLRGYILSHNITEKRNETQADDRILPPPREFTDSRKSKAFGANQTSNDQHLRIPVCQSSVVQQRTQTSSIVKHRRTTYGFPMRKAAWCNRKLKAGILDRPLFFSGKPEVNDGQKINIVHYVGIAADEPKRIKKHIDKPNMVLPLVQIGWDEALCGLEAQYMDMLAPTYTDSQLRDGCWFCHNQGIGQLRNLRKNYPDLWALLMKWDSDSPVTFHADGHTVHDFDKRFALEDAGLITPDDKFRWKMIEEDYEHQLKLF